jgi:hypothetical protein
MRTPRQPEQDDRINSKLEARSEVCRSHLKLVGGLMLVLLGQLVWSVPRLNDPFIDGQSHVDFDNANFMRHAAHSIDRSVLDSRKVFGVSEYIYDDQWKPVGINFYNHHGVLSPMLHTASAYLFGVRESTVRGFTLALSLMTTIAVCVLIYIELGSAVPAVVLCLVHALMPLRLTYLDQWKYEVGVEFVAMVCLASLALVRKRWSFGCYALILISFGLLFYAGYLFAACLWAWLLAVGIRAKSFLIPIHAALSGIVGVLTTLLIQYWLGFDISEIVGAFGTRSSGSMGGLTLTDIVSRQLLHLDFTYGSACLFVMLSGMLYPLLNGKVLSNLCAAAALIFFV